MNAAAPQSPAPVTPHAIRQALAGMGLAPNKALGQHFLADANLRAAFVAAAGVRPGDLVLEVGPGLGALTESLLETGATVVAVEIDRGLAAHCRTLFAGVPRFSLIEGDALDGRALAPPVIEALARHAARAPLPATVKLVSALPYNVGTTVMLATLDACPPFSGATVCLQDEVARRLVARPGNDAYGKISVLAAAHGALRLVRPVRSTVFFPPPKVASMIVTARWERRTREIPAHAGFLAVLDAAFCYRRKTLGRALRLAGYEPEAIQAAAGALGLDLGVRGETLDASQFEALGARLGVARGQ